MLKNFIKHFTKSHTLILSKIQKQAVETLAMELDCSFQETVDLVLLPHVLAIIEPYIPINEKDYMRYRDFLMIARQYQEVIK